MASNKIKHFTDDAKTRFDLDNRGSTLGPGRFSFISTSEKIYSTYAMAEKLWRVPFVPALFTQMYTYALNNPTKRYFVVTSESTFIAK